MHHLNQDQRCETSADQSPVEADKLEPFTKRKSTSRDDIEDEIDIIFKKLKEKPR